MGGGGGSVAGSSASKRSQYVSFLVTASTCDVITGDRVLPDVTPAHPHETFLTAAMGERERESVMCDGL